MNEFILHETHGADPIAKCYHCGIPLPPWIEAPGSVLESRDPETKTIRFEPSNGVQAALVGARRCWP